MKPDCGTPKHEPAVLRDGRLRRVRPQRPRRRESGQAITEFAMVLPLFAMLVLVCILFGKALYAFIQLTHTANEGARLAAVDQPQSGTLCSYLTNEAALPKGVTITISYPHPDAGSPAQGVGEPVTVTASTSASWVPIIGGALGNLTSSATMRIEQDTTTNATLGAGSC
jgi:Flp pilus assembly protein TadG